MSEGTMETQHLYGLPHAEYMCFDPAEVYEQVECDRDEDDRSPFVIEEWSVHEPIDHVPTADEIIEWIVQSIADNEVLEDTYDQFYASAQGDDVAAAAEVVRELLASKVTFRMSDQHLRDLTVTFNAEGEPLLDGKPMYVPAGGGDDGT